MATSATHQKIFYYTLSWAAVHIISNKNTVKPMYKRISKILRWKVEYPIAISSPVVTKSQFLVASSSTSQVQNDWKFWPIQIMEDGRGVI